MTTPLPYCSDPLNPRRRPAREVTVGHVRLGSGHPVRVQSMITCDTMDTGASVQQTIDLASVGCEIVRITAPTVKDAANLRPIVEQLRLAGCSVPIVADIHFKPDAALEAAKWVEKVRINPGNFADKKKFVTLEYTDEAYQAEIARVREIFRPLLKLCQERGIALRIGTNHGSLSDRLMNRYGDTPRGMVESALEFAEYCREENFHNFVFSMKSSNPKVMIQAYRMLAAELQRRGPDWNYPLHLGVTEAGDGEDGRIKSAIGIGSLLADGLGDTVRVSLTEDSVHEIPVAYALVRPYNDAQAGLFTDAATELLDAPDFALSFDPYSYTRRASARLGVGDVFVGGGETVRVLMRREKFDQIAHKIDKLGDFQPEAVYEDSGIVELDPRDTAALEEVNRSETVRLVTLPDGLALAPIPAYRLLAARLDPRHPILLKDTQHPSHDPQRNFTRTLLDASTVIGSLLCDGIGDAILIQGEEAPGQSLRLAYNILQAAGVRIFKTDYVACPSCGRTLFNLQETTARIKEATAHLKGVKIAIMGCIVNGPGEMADADFGYVGGAPGKINLYVGKTPVKFNIPQGEAVARLVDLIKEHGKWVDAPVANVSE